MPEEEKQDPTAAPQGAVPPVGGAGAVRLSPSAGVASLGGAAPSGGTTGGTAAGAPPPTAGGQFGSLNQYLTANQGQAAPLAQKVTTGINNQYNNLNTQGNAALGAINNQIAAGAAPNATDANSIIAQETANPSSFTSTPANVTSFQNLLNASYGGPTSAESTNTYQNQQNAVNSAISAGQNAVGTEAGRENLLSQNETAPTTGVTALNSAILSQDPNALGSIENAYAPFSGLLNNLQTGAGTANTQIAQEQGQAAQAQQASNQAINNQINTLNTGVTGELTAAQQAATTQNAQIKSDLAAGTPTPADLQALGMTPTQWSSLSAADKAAATAQVVTAGGGGEATASSGTTTIDPTQFLTQQNPNNAITAANIATPQDYANAQAFQTLLQGMNTQAPATIINPTTVSQAGTAPTNLNQYNYQTALNTATSTKADEVAAAQAYVNAIQSGMDENHAQQVAADAAKTAQYENNAAAASTIVGAPTAALAASGVGGDVGKYANLISQTIGAPVRQIETGAVKQGVLGQGSGTAGGAAKSTAAQSAVNMAGLGIPQAANAIVNAVKCFVKDTLIEMQDGTEKAIQDIKIGDETRGGKVTLTIAGESNDLYEYKGIVVVGGHSILPSYTFVRDVGRKIEPTKELPVYCICTTEHSIWIKGIGFSDAVSMAWFDLYYLKNEQNEARELLQEIIGARHD
jgi:hypothetical protein